MQSRQSVNVNDLTMVSQTESTHLNSAYKGGRNRYTERGDHKLSVDFRNQDDFDNFINPEIDPYTKKKNDGHAAGANAKKYKEDLDGNEELIDNAAAKPPVKQLGLKKNQQLRNKQIFMSKLNKLNIDPEVDNMYKKIEMQQLVKMGVMDQDELNDYQENPENEQSAPTSFFGFDYNYRTETDDEDKYFSKENKNFQKMKRENKNKHILSLWRRAFNQGLGCAIIINQFITVHTKMVYFGRQVLGGQSQLDKKAIEEVTQKQRKVSSCLIMPDSTAKKIWDVVILIILIYTAIYSPFKVAYLSKGESSSVLIAFETLVDVLFASDILVMFFTPYERKDGSLECRHKRIAKNYLLGPFWIDGLASFPTQLFEAGDETEGSESQSNKLARLARLQRLYRLLRIFRVIKLVKISKYNKLLARVLESLQLEGTKGRIMKILVVSLFTIHLFACFFWLVAHMKGFSSDTWVNQKDFIDLDVSRAYSQSVYWAAQTLTTVGYGDFGAYNGYEIGITCIWMFIGVIVYAIVVGTLTSMFTSEGTIAENLAQKIKAFETFAQDTVLDQDLKKDIQQFLMNNYTDLILKVDIESMIDDLPSWIKEDVLVNQFGFLIKNLEFFSDIQDSSCWWGIVQKLVKISVDRGDKLYNDGEISDQIFFIHKGVVKLYGDFGYPFASFKQGMTVGDNDVFSGTRRNGTATATDNCLLYKIFKNQIEEALQDFKATKTHLTRLAMEKNEKLAAQRLISIKKQPIYQKNSVIPNELLQAQKKIKQLAVLIKQKMANQMTKSGDSAFEEGTDNENEGKENDTPDIMIIDENNETKDASPSKPTWAGTAQNIIEKGSQLAKMNLLQLQSSDSTSQFTDGVNKLVKISNQPGVRDSLDFEHQKEQLHSGNTINSKYKDSRKMRLLKNQYQRANVLPEITEQNENGQPTARATNDNKAKEFSKLKKQAMDNLPWFQEIDDLQEVLENDDIGDDVAENTFEALVQFNSDMKNIALNAYQLQTLLNNGIEENILLIDWMQELEKRTLKYEDDIARMAERVDGKTNGRYN